MTDPKSRIELPAIVRQELDAAHALPEIVVLYDPSPEVLEAYALDERIGVVAVVSAQDDRAGVLDSGALEVLDPALPPAEALIRVQNAVARFRSRLHLERTQEELDKYAVTMEANLRLAARLQRSFLPRVLPELPPVRFSTAYLPREFVSGDSYEVRRLGPTQVAVYTLDCVGHDVRAALLTVLLRSVFRPVEGGTVREPHEVLREMNAYLSAAKLEESPTAAFCYGILDTQTSHLRLANAGHPLPVRLRQDYEPTELGTSGLLLGVEDDEEYETVEVELQLGDRVAFFTDGANPGYDSQFGRQLYLHRDLSLEDMVGGALGSMIELDEDGRPEDDITVVALEFRGAEGADSPSS